MLFTSAPLRRPYFGQSLGSHLSKSVCEKRGADDNTSEALVDPAAIATEQKSPR